MKIFYDFDMMITLVVLEKDKQYDGHKCWIHVSKETNTAQEPPSLVLNGTS